jgi:hypothetical protein
MADDLYTKAVAMASKAAVVSLLNKLIGKGVLSRLDAVNLLDVAIEELEEKGTEAAASAATIIGEMQKAISRGAGNQALGG